VRRIDVPLLPLLCAADQQDHQCGAITPEINPVARPKKDTQFVKSTVQRLEVAEADRLIAGGGGTDIEPLATASKSVVLIGYLPDSQRYFDLHHSAKDVFENVNKRELELGSAAMASLIYLIDQHGLQ